jgi:lysophospholipase L1-like esterase
MHDDTRPVVLGDVSGWVADLRLRVRGRGRGALSSSRRLVLLAASLGAVLLVSAIGVAPAAVASRRPAGRRVTVAVFGDSVVESVLVPNFLQRGLVPQLSRAVWSLGFAQGGVGLIPATPFRWHFNASVALGARSIPPNGWVTIGASPFLTGYDGLSGYSAMAFTPLATASVAVSDPEVEILYTSSTAPCTFDVSSAGRIWTINTFRHGTATDTGTWIKLPAGRHGLTIHGPSCGLLLFDGVIARRRVRPGKVQVEFEDLGHSAEFPSIYFGPRIQQALIDQRFDVSVFLFGYIGEDVGAESKQYLRAVTARARIARKHGGACLIVEPTPIEVPRSSVTTVSRLDRTAARREGCVYTTVLAHLWSNATTAERRGLVFVDGIHPTASGYKLIVRALAPVIAKMIRAPAHPSAS